jgi:hypothetical protein
MKRPEELIAEVGKIALKSNFKPSTAVIMGASSLIAIALIERYSPKIGKVVREIVKSANLHVNMPVHVPLPAIHPEAVLPHLPAIHVTPLSRHPEGHALPLPPGSERQAGRSEVIRAIAVGRQN